MWWIFLYYVQFSLNNCFQLDPIIAAILSSFLITTKSLSIIKREKKEILLQGYEYVPRFILHLSPHAGANNFLLLCTKESKSLKSKWQYIIAWIRSYLLPSLVLYFGSHPRSCTHSIGDSLQFSNLLFPLCGTHWFMNVGEIGPMTWQM